MKRFLGVDGGGTKTDFLLIDEGGHVLATHREGSAYYLETGLSVLEQVMVTGIRQMLDASGLSAEDITYGLLGLPAYGENEAMLASLDRIADEALGTGRYRCVNDVNCGWAGALAAADGIAVVAGTGSIAYGQLGAHSARCGGWGEMFSDEGSAHWIAREALTAFSRMSDGRTPRGPLHGLIRKHFAVESDLEVCAAVYGPPALGRREIAALARLVEEAARAGDTEAIRIFKRAAQELSELVGAVHDALHPSRGLRVPVSWCGGMLRSNGLLLPLFDSALQASGREYELRSPRLAPCAGAALYAATLAGSPLSSRAVDQLTTTHAAGTESEQA